MDQAGIPPVEQRELGLQKLRDLTAGVAVVATVGVGLFAVIAATTNPGRSDAAAGGGNTAATTAANNSTETDDSNGGSGEERHHHDGFNPTSSGSLNSGTTTPVAVTGGSR